jgi:hypothetical protein
MCKASFSSFGSIIANSYEKHDIAIITDNMEINTWETPKSSGRYSRTIIGTSIKPIILLPILPDNSFNVFLKNEESSKLAAPIFVVI